MAVTRKKRKPTVKHNLAKYHKIIDKALRNDKEIKCLVFDSVSDISSSIVVWVTRYTPGRKYPYMSSKGVPFTYAKPISRLQNFLLKLQAFRLPR